MALRLGPYVWRILTEKIISPGNSGMHSTDSHLPVGNKRLPNAVWILPFSRIHNLSVFHASFRVC